MTKEKMTELVELIRRVTGPVPPSGRDIIVPRKYCDALIKEMTIKKRGVFETLRTRLDGKACEPKNVFIEAKKGDGQYMRRRWKRRVVEHSMHADFPIANLTSPRSQGL